MLIGIYSEQGNLDIIKYLFQKGVNIKQINKKGYNLLFIAVGVSGYNYYDYDIMKYLLQHIDISYLDHENNTFLSYLDNVYLEHLIENNDLSNKQLEVLEIIYSKDLKKLMPYDYVYCFKEIKNKTCGICLENFNELEILNECQNKHTFHRECVIKWYQESKKIKCPYCTLRFPLNNKAIKCL